MKCVFCGSPEFAVPFLEAIQNSKRHQVVGVITQPDRPAKRGMALTPPAIKTAALNMGIPILQPEKINSEDVIHWISASGAQIIVVVAYGEFLGKKILSLFNHPPINVHPSKLPELRGAAPVQWAILNGLEETGVSVQFMAPKMDAGDILAQEPVPITPTDTSEELFAKVTPVGTRLLISALDQIEDGTVQPQPQNDDLATFAPLLKKEDGSILWSAWSASECHNRIRGLFPWPAAFTAFHNKRIKLLKSSLPVSPPWGGSAKPGEFVLHGDDILVRCASGILAVQLLQPEGKRPMLPSEFVNGIQTQQPCFAFDAGKGPK